jgi:hypothetical protein
MPLLRSFKNPHVKFLLLSNQTAFCSIYVLLAVYQVWLAHWHINLGGWFRLLDFPLNRGNGNSVVFFKNIVGTGCMCPLKRSVLLKFVPVYKGSTVILLSRNLRKYCFRPDRNMWCTDEKPLRFCSHYLNTLENIYSLFCEVTKSAI